jgi:drug/metabolite transporter (DMT)-like permease
MNWFLIAFISALFSAAAALSQKKVLFKIEALKFSFYLSIISLIFSIPFFFGIKIEALNQDAILILYIKSLLSTFAFLFVMLTLKNFEISKALPFMVLTPGLVAVFAFLFLNDTLSIQEISGILLLMVGTYILETSGFNKQSFKHIFAEVIKSSKYKYIIFALILFTASSILDRLLLTNYKLPPTDFMAFQQLFIAINFLIIMLIKNKGFHFVEFIKEKNLVKWVVVISILTIGYRYTQIEAIKLAPVALVLAVKRISVFFSVIAGGKIFKESNLVLRVVATAIMVAGTILLLNY